MFKVHIQNDSNVLLIILWKSHMSQVVKYEAERCYSASSDNIILALFSCWKQSWVRSVMKDLLATVTVFHISMNRAMKCKLSNDITIYRSTLNTFTQIKVVVQNHVNLWEDYKNIVDLSEKQWMDISLIDDWQEKYKPDQAWVYSLDANDRAIVDKVFDKLHNQNQMKWITSFTSFSFSCFVVWHILSDNTQKDCVVINIRVLNKISISDVYSVSV